MALAAQFPATAQYESLVFDALALLTVLGTARGLKVRTQSQANEKPLARYGLAGMETSSRLAEADQQPL